VTTTKIGHVSTYDVTKLLRQRFNSVELVVAGWTSSSARRGLIRVTVDGDKTTTVELSELPQSSTTGRDGTYHRFNVSLVLENVRRRMSTGNQQDRFFAVLLLLFLHVVECLVD